VTGIEPAAPRPRLWTLAAATAVLFLGVLLFGWIAVATWVLVARPDLSGGSAALQEEILAALSRTSGLLVAAAASGLWIAGVALGSALLSPQPIARRLSLRRPCLPVLGWLAAIAGGLAVSQGVDAVLQLSGFGRGHALGNILGAIAGVRGGTLALALLLLGVLPGVAEELFFRGYLQTRLVERFGALAGVTVAAVLFALAHFDPQHSFFAFAFGLYVGGVAVATRSLWPAVAAHAANNLASVATIALGLDDVGSGAAPQAVLLGVSLLVLAGSVAWLRRHSRDRARAADCARAGSTAPPGLC
jgi:hypothetical protein